MNEWKDIYSAADLARMINVSNSYISRLCRKGIIPAKKLGATWIIRKEDIDIWLSRRPKDTNEN